MGNISGKTVKPFSEISSVTLFAWFTVNRWAHAYIEGEPVLQLLSLNNNYDSLHWKENNFAMTPLYHFLFLRFVCFASSLKEENPFSQFSFTKYAAERTLPTHTLQYFRYQHFHPGLGKLFLNLWGGNMIEIFTAGDWKIVRDANSAISTMPPVTTATLKKPSLWLYLFWTGKHSPGILSCTQLHWESYHSLN